MAIVLAIAILVDGAFSYDPSGSREQVLRSIPILPRIPARVPSIEHHFFIPKHIEHDNVSIKFFGGIQMPLRRVQSDPGQLRQFVDIPIQSPSYPMMSSPFQRVQSDEGPLRRYHERGESPI